MAEDKLTINQQAFVDAYDGRIEPAAEAAGLSYEYCRRLITKSHIVKAIQERQSKEKPAKIATRQRRQEFWAEVMEDTEENMKERLRASELLGKSEADFTDKIEATVRATVTSEPLSDEEWQNEYTEGDKT